MHPRKLILGALVVAMSALASVPASAITISSFGSFGEAGDIWGLQLTIGPGGNVDELNAFLRFDAGPTFVLSDGTLPGLGIGVGFAYALSDADTDLTLTYTFTNNTGADLADVRFFSFLDSEIDETLNSFFNEYGQVVGSTGAGAGDADPDSWEIDIPFGPGSVNANIDSGFLDNTNAVPLGSPDDVSMALGFLLGPLAASDSVSIRVFLSEDLNSIGTLRLVHRDLNSLDTVITMSGQVVGAAPEPATLLLLGAGLTALATVRRRGSGGGSPRPRTPTSRRRGLRG